MTSYATRQGQLALMRAVRIPSMGGIGGGTLKAVLRCIDDHSGKNQTCYASQNTLAAESCYSRRTVARAVLALEQSGLVTAKHRMGRTSVFQVHWSAIANLCQTVTSANASLVIESHLTRANESETCDRESPEAVEAQLSGISADAEFDEFWGAVTKKKDKTAARKAYKVARRFFGAEHILTMARAYYSQSSDSRYLKHPATFLRQCLEDDPADWQSNQIGEPVGLPASPTTKVGNYQIKPKRRERYE
ncbi:MAG TPA: hypothetical protein DDW52_23530 [Planctomycetaceae bacterium]|nr:hypothetical protein [Planctomycetaceae bacterium]